MKIVGLISWGFVGFIQMINHFNGDSPRWVDYWLAYVCALIGLFS